jgi:N utilization substance protein A
VVAVFADPEERVAKVVVPDYQLSLAIGKEGQNARLAARLTGYKIDIKNETQAKDAPGFRYEDYLDADEDEYEEEYEEGYEEEYQEDYEEAEADAPEDAFEETAEPADQEDSQDADQEAEQEVTSEEEIIAEEEM